MSERDDVEYQYRRCPECGKRQEAMNRVCEACGNVMDENEQEESNV